MGPPMVSPSEIRVTSPRPTVLVRSTAFIPGFHATYTPDVRGARTISLTVRRHGLVQAVDVPRGEGTVTFSYSPPGFVLGAAGTMTGIVALALLLAISRGVIGDNTPRPSAPTSSTLQGRAPQGRAPRRRTTRKLATLPQRQQ